MWIEIFSKHLTKKGTIDGVSGEVQQAVWKSILKGRHDVTTAKEFQDVALEVCRKIRILYTLKESLHNILAGISTTWERSKTKAGTQQVHFVKPCIQNQIDISKNLQFIFTGSPQGIRTVLPKTCCRQLQHTYGTTSVKENYRAKSWWFCQFPAMLSEGPHCLI